MLPQIHLRCNHIIKSNDPIPSHLTIYKDAYNTVKARLKADKKAKQRYQEGMDRDPNTNNTKDMLETCSTKRATKWEAILPDLTTLYAHFDLINKRQSSSLLFLKSTNHLQYQTGCEKKERVNSSLGHDLIIFLVVYSKHDPISQTMSPSPYFDSKLSQENVSTCFKISLHCSCTQKVCSVCHNNRCLVVFNVIMMK